MINAGYILFLNKRTILDIEFFRFSYENWLSHICLKLEHRQLKGLSRGFWASEEYEYARSQIHCTNMHAHLSIVSDCHDVIKNLGRKVAQVFYNGLSRCLIVKPNGQGDSERICDLPY